jgi:site-specific DNA recombinase
MKKAIIYCRVSTKEQAKEDRFSLAVQKRLCAEYAEKENIKVVKIFEDPGKSATNMNRFALKNMIEFIEENKEIKVVLVQDTDRIARNTFDHLAIKSILKKGGVQLISVSQPHLDDSIEGEMMDTVVASMNAYQAGITGRKTKKGMEEKVLSGWYPGPAPHGYKNDTDKNNNKIIRINNRVAEYIKMAFKMYATGKYSVLELRDILHSKGFRSKRGFKIHVGKMNYILKNDFYIGELHWGNIHVKGKHDPIINRTLFQQVIRVMDNHNHHACRRRKYTFLLRGFIFCVCGTRMTAGKFKNKTKDYYLCQNGSKCKESYVPTNILEKKVENLLKKIQFSDTFINMIISEVKKGYREIQKFNKNRRKELTNNRDKFKEREKVAYKKLLDGIFDDEEFTEIRDDLREQIDNIDCELSRIKYQRNLNLDQIQTILYFAKNIHGAYIKAPEDVKKQYLSLFFEKLVVSNKKIKKAILNPLFDSLIKAEKALYKTQKLSQKETASVPSASINSNSKVKINTEWGDRWDLNPRPPEPQSDALPTELLPPRK